MDGPGQGRTTEAASAPNGMQRGLQIAVVAMGILIVLGVLIVIGRIIYLASRGPAQSSSQVAIAEMSRVVLPAGAVVRSTALSGDRLALHFDAPSGPGVAVVDLSTGRVVSRIEFLPEAPRR